MEKTNYQRWLDATLENLQKEGKKPSLLLHCCCAPCSSYVLEYLNRFFHITAFYYNPNISPAEEYGHRLDELRRLTEEMPLTNPVEVVGGAYEPEKFRAVAKGHEQDPEGGERCFACYRLRLEESVRLAKEQGFDYFTTTLSISPLKNAEKLNAIGKELSEQYGVPYLYSDFKKKEGYKRSCALSAMYHLYRQDYCGCVYSKAQKETVRE